MTVHEKEGLVNQMINPNAEIKCSIYGIPGLKRYDEDTHDYSEYVIKVVADFCKVNTAGIINRNITRKRDGEVIYAMQLCAYFLKENTKMSLKSIGEKLGNRDHTTVIYSKTRIEDLIFSDPLVRNDVEIIKSML